MAESCLLQLLMAAENAAGFIWADEFENLMKIFS
jgi:hypothetical protein